jgi:dTMP kinase
MQDSRLANRFITLEGIEGVGKSTHMAFIAQYLQQAGQTVVLTREPGGTPVAEAIRHLLLKQHDESITQETELLLLFAGRAQHIAHVIRPALAMGKWVVCDRFTDATYAYQGGGRGLSPLHIATLEQWVQKDLQPVCTLLLDAPVRVALQRTRQRGQLDRIETEQEDFFQQVRAAYLTRARQFPARYRIIDANMPLCEVQQQIKLILDKLLA